MPELYGSDEWLQQNYPANYPRPKTAKAKLLETLDRYENAAGALVPTHMVRRWIEEACK